MSRARSDTSGYPVPTTPTVSKVMRANRKVGSKPEARLRSLLHRHGLRFRKNALIRVGGLKTRPDIVFPAARVAVFVDGCFWHRCPRHGVQPRANAWYWSAKLDRNVARDLRINNRLRDEGWSVIHVWEHEPTEAAAQRVESSLARKRAG
jgi:DNA mismatch endonuclease, patch repair protein